MKTPRRDSVLQLILHREVVLLLVLSMIAVPLFLFTLSMAARNREMNLNAATTWFERGQKQLGDGQTAAAISSFRKAATHDRDDPTYVLALATTLADSGQLEEAKQILLKLRISSPESGEVNLQLARVSQKQELTTEAIRYYHNALYGIWPTEQMVEQRRRIRTELIHVLLGAGDTEQSLSELLILSSDIPDTETAHNEVGHLFFEAEDWRRALEQFERTLRMNKQNSEALDGAGRAYFNLGDYRKASDYLNSAIASGAKDGETADLLDVSKSVLSRDPLAPRLLFEERTRRLAANFDAVSETLQLCIAQVQDDGAAALQDLAMELDRDRKSRYTSRKLRADSDEFRSALNLIYRAESSAAQICQESSPLSRALVIIAQRNGATE